MSADRELTRIVRSWLQTDEHESADKVLDVVFGRLDTTPQRRPLRQAWREFLVNSSVRFAAAGTFAVVVAAIAFAFYFTRPSVTPGGQPSPSVFPTSPSPAAVASPTPHLTSSRPPSPSQSPTADTLPAGRYAIRPDGFPADSLRLVLTVPAGYEAIGNGGEAWAMVKIGEEPTEFSGIGVWVSDAVYEDPCNWSATDVENQALGDFADDFVEALLAQPDRNASQPVDVGFDDYYEGKRLQLTVPSDLAFDGNTFTDCDQGDYRSWPGRSHQAPSQVDDIWVIEIGRDGTLPGAVPPPSETRRLSGTRLIVATTYFPTTSAEDRAELEAMFESIDLQVP